uniref:Uncharacterized protein n=1 Tax=Anguilla anguilla TaxID=7936 RepID=A0A0E9VJE5_ANGAN
MAERDVVVRALDEEAEGSAAPNSTRVLFKKLPYYNHSKTHK